MVIMILETVYNFIFFFLGYNDKIINEKYLEWYYCDNIVHVEPNIYTKCFLSGLGIIVLFVKFYYSQI